MKSFAFYLSLLALLAGCSSPVKLDTASVEDKQGQSTATTVNTVTDSSATTNKVATVDLSKNANLLNLVGAERVVYFEYDSFAIRPEFQKVIESHAQVLKADKNKRVVIDGHTDDRGGREYNLALGQKRSDAVRRALALLGVGDAQMESVSFGKEKPAAQGTTEDAMQKNRRAEIGLR